MTSFFKQWIKILSLDFGVTLHHNFLHLIDPGFNSKVWKSLKKILFLERKVNFFLVKNSNLLFELWVFIRVLLCSNMWKKVQRKNLISSRWVGKMSSRSLENPICLKLVHHSHYWWKFNRNLDIDRICLIWPKKYLTSTMVGIPASGPSCPGFDSQHCH